jgi:flagellar operon protein (TIGR03826 family)
MEIRNCPSCGKIFAYTLRNLCPECIKEDELSFNKVRDYIHENPNANLEEVAEAAEVTTKKVLEYLKEGRLMLKSSSGAMLQCEVCSEPILSGRLCEKCSREFKKGMWAGPREKRLDRGSTKAKVHLSKLIRDDRR